LQSIAKPILDRWATAVVPKEAIFLKQGQPQVNQLKCRHYEDGGYSDDLVLWIAPKDCIRIEFEADKSGSHRMILETESAAKSLGFDYCITSHKGKSDYFNMFNIKGIPLGEDNQSAKLLLIDLMLPQKYKDYLDRTNLGWTLSPIIEHSHWKPKYNGEIHKIIRGKNPIEHINKYPKELLKRLNKAKKLYKKNIIETKSSMKWAEDFLLNYCCLNKLPEGSRHFKIEKNLAALIIFRKDKEEIKKRYYEAQERKHDSLRTWEIAILNNKYSKVSSGELAKYIKDHTLEFDIPLEKEISDEEEDKNIHTSLYVDDEIIAEQINKEGINKFCIYNFKTNEVTYESKIEKDLTYSPIIGEEVYKKAILLPSEALEYETDEKLDKELKEHITKWLDVPEDVLQFAIWNIKRSWVYDKFHTLNYLRALGDTGMGKTRFLDTLGYLHYKPIATSGATTAAPIFRVIEKWRGTLIMDEADFGKSDESQDIIKIINLGYEKGKNIMRCEQNDAKNLNFFDPYCPKILATRRTFQDKATESRCITQVMKGTFRKNIPLNLNQSFWDKVLELRNKLLLWRFRNYNKIDPNKEIDFDLGDLEPRVQQIVTSFVSLFGKDKKQLEKFKVFIQKHQDEIVEERRSSFAGDVVGTIYSMLKDKKHNISAQDIIDNGNITNQKGQKIKPRGLSSTLKSLGFEKSTPIKVEGKTKRCIPLDKEHLEHLFIRYGYEVTEVTIVTGTEEKNNINEKQSKIGEKLPPRANRMYRNYSNSVTELLEENKELSSQEMMVKLNISYGELYPILLKLKESGDIFELKPDRFRLLK